MPEAPQNGKVRERPAWKREVGSTTAGQATVDVEVLRWRPDEPVKVDVRLRRETTRFSGRTRQGVLLTRAEATALRDLLTAALAMDWMELEARGAD